MSLEQAANPQQQSIFKTAFPYGAASLALGAAGAATAIICTATALKVLGIVGAVIGAYSFFAVVACGLFNNSSEFTKELPKYMSTIVGSAVADIIKNIALEVLSGLIDKALGRDTSNIRFSRL